MDVEEAARVEVGKADGRPSLGRLERLGGVDQVDDEVNVARMEEVPLVEPHQTD